MSHRTSTDSTESLELLLDTICNTFGAVIFISMLVAVLISRQAPTNTAAEKVQDAVAEAAAVQMQIQQAQTKLRVLSAQLRQQQLLTDRFASEESVALAASIHEQSQDQIANLQQKSAAVAGLTDTQASIAALQQEILRQQQSQAAAAQEHERLRQEILKQQQLSGRTARIPRVRRTTKQSCVYALDDGRLYRVTTPQLTIDDVDCVQMTVSGSEQITPRPAAGLPISAEAATEIRQKFAGVDPDSQFVQLFVARDSFAAFLPVKDVLVDLGIEYEVLVTEDDSVELFFGTSMRENFVQ